MMKTSFFLFLFTVILWSCSPIKNNIHFEQTNYTPPKINLTEYIKLNSQFKDLNDLVIAAKEIKYEKDSIVQFYKNYQDSASSYKIVANVYVQTMCNGAGLQTWFEWVETKYKFSVTEDPQKKHLKKLINKALITLGDYPYNYDLCEVGRHIAFWFDEKLVIYGIPNGEREGCFALLWFQEKLYKIEYIEGGALGSISSFCQHHLGLKIKDSLCNPFDKEAISKRSVLDSIKNVLLK